MTECGGTKGRNETFVTVESAVVDVVWTMQVTVVFLVDADKCLPSKEEWPQVWEKQQAWLQAKKTHEDEQVSFWLTCAQAALAYTYI